MASLIAYANTVTERNVGTRDPVERAERVSDSYRRKPPASQHLLLVHNVVLALELLQDLVHTSKIRL